MSSKRLLKLIGNIDDEFILNATEYRPSKVRKLHTAVVIGIITSVACVAFILSSFITFVGYARTNMTAASKLQSHGMKTDEVHDVFYGNFISECYDLRVDKINESSIEVSYILKDEDDYDEDQYTYNDIFELVRVNEGNTDYVPNSSSPKREIDPSETKIPLGKTENHMIMELPDDMSPLEPGHYVLIGYIYTEGIKIPYAVYAEFDVYE